MWAWWPGPVPEQTIEQSLWVSKWECSGILSPVLGDSLALLLRTCQVRSSILMGFLSELFKFPKTLFLSMLPKC